MGSEMKSTTSQEDQILSHLLQGHTLTPLEALDKFRCFRLAARIHGLIHKGYTINCDRKRVVAADGVVSIVAEYSMPQAGQMP